MLDHLVLATPDVDETGAWLASATGVTPSPGGPHPGFGTRNVLCALGSRRYLEVVGPDESQPAPAEPRPFGVDDLDRATLVTWCAGTGDIDGFVDRAGHAGLRFTPPRPMSRRAPEGLLEWRLSFPEFDTMAGAVPFVIDWGGAGHPSATAASGLELVHFGAHHPDPPALRAVLDALGLDLAIEPGSPAGLVAVVAGPSGAVELPSG